MIPMKEGFLGLNILAAWIALSLPLEILNFPFEDLPESIFFTVRDILTH